MQLKIKLTILTCFLIIVILSTYYLVPKPISDNVDIKIEVNVCLHIWDYNDTTLSTLRDLNVQWVRTDWVSAPDNLMVNYANSLQENSIDLLAIIDINTFNQQKVTLREWNNTVTQIVSSKDFNSVDAVEIWNEPNGIAYIPSSTYYEMLKDAYVIIKNYSSIPVVFAGISPNIEGWQTYLNEVFANENVEDYFDYMGLHLYDDMQTNLDILAFIKGLTSKPVWLTETGKPSINNVTEQAQYIGAIYEGIAPEVSKTFIYELYDGQGAEPLEENYFGLLTINGTKKEAYNLIYNLNER